MAFVADDPALSRLQSATALRGAREADVCLGATASLVNVEYKIEYYTDASQPIVDNQWFGNLPPLTAFPTIRLTSASLCCGHKAKARWRMVPRAA